MIQAPHLLSGLGMLVLAGVASSQTALLTGRVLDVLGDPIPAALVQVTVKGQVLRKTYADGEGIYLITKIPEGGGDLRISAKGKASRLLKWQGPRTPPVRNATLRDAGKVVGQVTDAAGQPVADIDVVAIHGEDSQRARTDALGNYVIDTVPVGHSSIHVGGSNSTTHKSVHVRAETECNLQILANNAVRRQVRVTGLPDEFEGAFVSVINANLVLLQDGGRFPLAPDGTAMVVLNDTALVTPVIEGYTLTPSGRLAVAGTTTLAFAAKPAGAAKNVTEISGSLRTSVGRKVPNETLFFYDHSSQLLGKVKVDRHGKFRGSVQTSPTGEYRIGMPLDKWELVDDMRTLQDGFTWVTAHSTNEIELFVQASGTLKCPVRDAKGRLLMLADVTIANPRDPHCVLVQSACDRMGQFEMALPAEQYEVLAVAHDGLVCKGTVQIRAGGKRSEVRWKTIPTSTVEGRLVDKNGKAVPGVELYVAARELLDMEEVRAAERQKARIFTDRHGRFRCRGLPSGEWTIVALDHPGVDTTSVTLRPGKDVNVRIVAAN